MWLSHAVYGSCAAEPTLKVPSMGQKPQRATFIQVIVFIFLVTDGVWSHRELSTKLDSLARLSAPLLLGPPRPITSSDSTTRCASGFHVWHMTRCRSPRRSPITLVPSSISSATTISRGLQHYLCSTTGVTAGRMQTRASPSAGAPGTPGCETGSVRPGGPATRSPSVSRGVC